MDLLILDRVELDVFCWSNVCFELIISAVLGQNE